MAPSRSATAALQKKAASKQSASKKPAPKKAAPKKPLKPKPTISEQIVKMKEKPKSNWIKADFVKYSELLEKMHAGAAEEPPTEEPVFPPASDDEPSPLPTKPPRMGPSAAAKGAKGPVDPKPPRVSFESDPKPPRGSDDEPSRVRKLEPPKVRFSGSEDYEIFKRQVLIWESKYEGKFSQSKLGAEVMEVLSEGALEAVFALVPEKQESLEKILKALDQRYGKKAMPKATSAVEFCQVHAREAHFAQLPQRVRNPAVQSHGCR